MFQARGLRRNHLKLVHGKCEIEKEERGSGEGGKMKQYFINYDVRNKCFRNSARDWTAF